MKRSHIAAYELNEAEEPESDVSSGVLMSLKIGGQGNVGPGEKRFHAELKSNGSTDFKDGDEEDAELAVSRGIFKWSRLWRHLKSLGWFHMSGGLQSSYYFVRPRSLFHIITNRPCFI